VRRLSAEEPAGAPEMVGASEAFNAMLAQLIDASASEMPTLLTGETGVGKELAARFIHAHSAQCGGALVVLDCTAIPETLFEAELFGHERGAFTGPLARRIGLVEAAENGTLFLDELGELPLPLQAKLLRFIEHGEFRRLGANEVRQVSCRIVAATNQDLIQRVEAGLFRRDLYHRLAGIEIRLPPLRERGDDFSLIAQAQLQRLPLHQRCTGFTPEAVQRMRALRFGGNIRELSHLVRRASQRAGAGWITPAHLGLDATSNAGADPTPTLPRGLQPSASQMPPWPAVDTQLMAATYPRSGGDGVPLGPHAPQVLGAHIRSLCACGVPRREVAQRLGVSERTVYRHLARDADAKFTAD
jgi:DNA-binding NtrC family response regulator